MIGEKHRRMMCFLIRFVRFSIFSLFLLFGVQHLQGDGFGSPISSEIDRANKGKIITARTNLISRFSSLFFREVNGKSK